MTACPLCQPQNETCLWQDERCRVVLANDSDYPAFCRVVWHTHVKEMTDLSVEERAHCMFVVFSVEEIVRNVTQPDKMNLASLGNQVPHLHWHVIPRFTDDAHYPDPIWSNRRRTANTRLVDVGLLKTRLHAKLNRGLNE